MKQLFLFIYVHVPFLFIAHCAAPVFAKSEIYLESTKVPFTEGLQTDFRARWTPTKFEKIELFLGLQYENYTAFDSKTQGSYRLGPSLGFKLPFLEYFGAVAEHRYYWSHTPLENTGYDEFRAGLYFFAERNFEPNWLWKNYAEIFQIPRLSTSSLTAAAYSRLLYLEGHPSALQVAPYLELSATENSDRLAFGRQLRELKTGLSFEKKWPETKVEFLLFKNWYEKAEVGPSEIRGQLVLFGEWP